MLSRITLWCPTSFLPARYDLATSQLKPILDPLPTLLLLPMYIGPFILQKSSIKTPSSMMHGPLTIDDSQMVAFGDTDVVLTSDTRTLFIILKRSHGYTI